MEAPIKILIADDEHKIIMTLEYAFRKAGYEVFIARDGSEVLEILKTEIPDIILLDIMMPVLDGWFVLAELQGRALRPQVIVCSAKTADADRERALNLGAAAYVTKPYSPDDLIAKIHTVLAQGEAHVSV
mgnify:CR=1 FL=1